MKTTTIVGAVVSAVALAGCSVDKGKPDLAGDLSTTWDAVESTGGRWSEVRQLQSAHPYANDVTDELEVVGSPDAIEMQIVLERFELEAGYDFVTVIGDAGDEHILTGERSGEAIVVEGNRVRVRFATDYSVTRWGYSIRVMERQGCTCAEIYAPVCGADEQTYSNECEANCAGARIAYRGECQTDAWVSVNRRVESAHPYDNDLDQVWEVREVGATSIRVHFARLDVERGYDEVRVLDGNDQVVARYTGQQDDFHTAVVQGDTVRIRLTSDYSVTSYGFVVDYYQVAGGCNSDADCRSGMVCAQVQCIRAPCFNVCEAAPTTGYVDVTASQLQADPTAFDGQRIRVTAEPTVRALCTRRGCSQADPCCNVCSGSYVVAPSVDLRDAGDQPYGCRGNECSWQGTCREFAPENAGPYTFEGTLRANLGGGASLLVDQFRAVDCQTAGCSGQACANSPNVITTCDSRPEYACYRNTACEPQATGHCGWTETPQLLMCLANASAVRVAAADTPLAIPDDDAAGTTSRIAVLGGGTVSQVELTLEILHTYRGDLVVTLISPQGTRVVLHDGAGGSNHDLVILDRELPELAAEPRAGEWQLHVRDRYAQDLGTLEGWSLTFR